MKSSTKIERNDNAQVEKEMNDESEEQCMQADETRLQRAVIGTSQRSVRTGG